MITADENVKMANARRDVINFIFKDSVENEVELEVEEVLRKEFWYDMLKEEYLGIYIGLEGGYSHLNQKHHRIQDQQEVVMSNAHWRSIQ